MIKMNIPDRLNKIINRLLNTSRNELKPIPVKAKRGLPGMPVHRHFPSTEKDLMRW